ncbi:hypothetical protein F5Y09DRAFT_338904 [Xylaria sp. FL1042]|nr:hypothetical protein F5Y09DRAFT_338904 [Xylaria sp. FL1042]
MDAKSDKNPHDVLGVGIGTCIAIATIVFAVICVLGVIARTIYVCWGRSKHKRKDDPELGEQNTATGGFEIVYPAPIASTKAQSPSTINTNYETGRRRSVSVSGSCENIQTARSIPIAQVLRAKGLRKVETSMGEAEDLRVKAPRTEEEEGKTQGPN